MMLPERWCHSFRAASEVCTRSLSGSNLLGVQHPSVAIATPEDTYICRWNVPKKSNIENVSVIDIEVNRVRDPDGRVPRK